MKRIPDSQRELYREIGRRIAKRRSILGLSQLQLAARLGVSRPSLSNVERGAQRLLVNSLFEIAAALNTSPADLLPLSPSNRPNVNHSDVIFLKDLCSRLSCQALE
jgi:transcriptional regulator with XRE-family HTH domain